MSKRDQIKTAKRWIPDDQWKTRRRREREHYVEHQKRLRKQRRNR